MMNITGISHEMYAVYGKEYFNGKLEYEKYPLVAIKNGYSLMAIFKNGLDVVCEDKKFIGFYGKDAIGEEDFNADLEAYYNKL